MARILVVEDEVNSARALESFFTSMHHEVKTAARADRALDIAASFNPHVVLTDLLLAGDQDGIVVARALARCDPPPCVILMSGLPLPEIEERAQGEPVCDIQAKPLRLHRIRDVVERALAEQPKGAHGPDDA